MTDEQKNNMIQRAASMMKEIDAIVEDIQIEARSFELIITEEGLDPAEVNLSFDAKIDALIELKKIIDNLKKV
jgi:predicted secreted protein